GQPGRDATELLGLVVAPDGNGVADRELRGGGGIAEVAGEPEKAVGVWKDDPLAAFHAREVAAIARAEGLPAHDELEPPSRWNAGGDEIVGLRVEFDVAVVAGNFEHARLETATV